METGFTEHRHLNFAFRLSGQRVPFLGVGHIFASLMRKENYH